jgi:molybdenum cofactor cytidylyltransferase
MVSVRAFRLDAIVLAAGAGTRFGGDKLTIPWRGGRLIDGALKVAARVATHEVLVVTGADRGVGRAVADVVKTMGPSYSFRLIHAVGYSNGMSASLRAGIKALSPDCDGVFVVLGDMPLAPEDVLVEMAIAVAYGAVASAPICDGVRGHPVLFTRKLFPALLRLKGDTGAREVLHGLGKTLALIKTSDPGVLLDVDAPGDLDALG